MKKLRTIFGSSSFGGTSSFSESKESSRRTVKSNTNKAILNIKRNRERFGFWLGTIITRNKPTQVPRCQVAGPKNGDLFFSLFFFQTHMS